VSAVSVQVSGLTRPVSPALTILAIALDLFGLH